MTIFWQILAFGLVAALVLLLFLAIVEPGPLQKPRTFGRSRRQDAGQDTAPENDPLTGTRPMDAAIEGPAAHDRNRT
jgi:hypothetical protein